jgi:MFS family permease
MAAANFAGSAISGWLADRIGDRQITFAGAVVTGCGLLLAGTTGGTPTMGAVVFATVVLGFGFGIHQAAVYSLTLRGTPSRHVGASSAALSVSQTIGTVLSIALMTTLLNWQQSANGGSFIEAYRFSYIAAAGIAVLAGAVVFKMPANKT